MQISVLIFVSLLELLQVLKLVDEGRQLVLKTVHFPFTLLHLLLFLFQLVGFLIDLAIKFFSAIDSL